MYGGDVMQKRHSNLRDIVNHIISVSDLGRGKASKVIKNIESDNESYIIVKNNKPKAVIVSVDEYNRMVDSLEKMELLLLASKRIKTNKQSEYLAYEDVLAEFHITAEEIETLQDTIELE